MNKVQEALKAAVDYFRHDNFPIGADREYRKNRLAVYELCKSALSAIEKCEPVGEVEPIGYMSNLAIQRLSQRGLGAITLHKTKTCFNPVYYTSPISKEHEDWQYFDEAYKKATESSDPDDWMNAALMAQQVRRKQLNAPEKG